MSARPEWLNEGESVLMPDRLPGWAIIYDASGVACRMLWFARTEQ